MAELYVIAGRQSSLARSYGTFTDSSGSAGW